MDVESIAEQLFFTTVRVEAESDAGCKSVGTSFIFTHENQGIKHGFLVTNKHVVKGNSKGLLTFIAAAEGKPNLGSGHGLEITGFDELWHGHPSESIDVTIAPLGQIIKLLEEHGFASFFKSISIQIVPTDEEILGLDALEEVIFIGYPNNIWDKANFLPVARRGITATPLSIDFDGEKKFLVDASVFPGSSGSPVFLYNAGMYHDKKGTTYAATRVFFLGVISGVYCHEEELIRVPELTSTSVSHSVQMINLGIVYKASTVIEAIEHYLKEQGII